MAKGITVLKNKGQDNERVMRLKPGITLRINKDCCKEQAIQINQYPFVWSTWEYRPDLNPNSYELNRNTEFKSYWSMLSNNPLTGVQYSYSRLTGRD